MEPLLCWWSPYSCCDGALTYIALAHIDRAHTLGGALDGVGVCGLDNGALGR